MKSVHYLILIQLVHAISGCQQKHYRLPPAHFHLTRMDGHEPTVANLNDSALIFFKTFSERRGKLYVNEYQTQLIVTNAKDSLIEVSEYGHEGAYLKLKSGVYTFEIRSAQFETLMIYGFPIDSNKVYQLDWILQKGTKTVKYSIH